MAHSNTSFVTHELMSTFSVQHTHKFGYDTLTEIKWIRRFTCSLDHEGRGGGPVHKDGSKEVNSTRTCIAITRGNYQVDLVAS